LGQTQGKPTPIHVILVRRLQQRLGVEAAPRAGDRVSFVAVNRGKGVPKSERGEDPVYAWNNNLPIDRDYYLEAVQRSMTRVFQPIFAPNLTDKKEIEREVGRHLFQGAHMLQVSNAGGKRAGAGLMAFAQARPTCLKCPLPVPDDHALCLKCRGEFTTTFLDRALDQVDVLERQSCQLWANCQRCMGVTGSGTDGTVAAAITCTNSGCDRYWERRKVGKELDKQRGLVHKLSSALDINDW
jgi:DNA polymerase delta subunit 1